MRRPTDLVTMEEVEDFLKLYGCRAKVKEELGKITFWVPKKDFHFVRWFVFANCPMGIFIEVKNLKFWECRFKKIQIIRGEE